MNSNSVFSKTKKEKQLKELAFLSILYICVTVAIVTLMTLIYDVISTGYSRLFNDYELGLINKVTIDNPRDFLTSLDSRDPLKAGIGPAFAGTVWLLIIVIFVTFPLGAGAAIYLQEFAPKNKLTRFIELNLTNLAGVPSVIYGLMGLAVFVRLAGFGRSVLSGGLTLTLLILPVVIVASREALKAVPDTIRQGALALGSTKFQAIFRQVVPSAIPGMVTGMVLGLSRALGETAPVIFLGAFTYVNYYPDTPRSGYTAIPIQV
jgi:phosphate transport system permease protein